MPARRRRYSVKVEKERKKTKLFWYVAILVVSLVSAFSYLFLRTKYWDKDSKLSVVIRSEDGDVLVSTFDPQGNEITNILIPGETQVDVARNLGTWRLASVWQLGENEGFSGKLLAETITYRFRFPVVAWSDSPGIAFTGTNLVAMARAVFAPHKTNLGLADRFHIALFALKVGNSGRVDILLKDTSYLRKARFVDGGEGYEVVGTPSPALSAVFADPKISAKATTVTIKDATGGGGAEVVGRVVEVLGAKVASIVKEDPKELDCVISGKEKYEVRRLSYVFSCGIGKPDTNSNFDIEITLGSEFPGSY